MNAPTPHNKAKTGDIAKTVIICGDPRRVKLIAESKLENPVLVSNVRNIFCYTGTYKGVPISVMAHGIGVPSVAIYVTELFEAYGVETIIRAGSAGAFQDNIELMDIILAIGASYDGNFCSRFIPVGTFAPTADYSLLQSASKAAETLGLTIHAGNLLTTDVYYATDEFNQTWRDMNVLAVDMETSVLYTLAAKYKKRALSILTVSDHLFKKQYLDSEQREKSFVSMLELALETAITAAK